jgi:hypothetical protein
MIDVHCLVYKESPYFSQIKAQMEAEEDVCFHVVPNGSNIGLGRAVGFLQGNAPYVSCVDYDDLIEPGIFTKINEVMESKIPWCYTDEMLIDEQGKHIQPGWSSNPKLYKHNVLQFVKVGNEYVHHILTFRRDLLTLKMLYIMKQLCELPEEYLRTELGYYEHTHIKEVGYYWRQHPENGMKKYQCYRDIERTENDKRMDS